MSLKSVAYTKAEQKERNSPYLKGIEYEGDKYPYGLRMDLNSDVMEKLDIDGLPATGSEVTICAKAKVVSTSVNDRNGKKEKRMELQITSMEVEFEEESAEDAIFKGMPDAD